jgi:hypothetical protein
MLAAAGNLSFQGAKLRFKKGIYVFGKDEGELPLRTQLEAHDTSEAWVKFVNGDLVEHIMRAPGVPFPERDELGDTDKRLWPAGLDGHPADPWVQNAYLYLIETAGAREFTFIGSSFGARKAVYQLPGK